MNVITCSYQCTNIQYLPSAFTQVEVVVPVYRKGESVSEQMSECVEDIFLARRERDRESK